MAYSPTPQISDDATQTAHAFASYSGHASLNFLFFIPLLSQQHRSLLFASLSRTGSVRFFCIFFIFLIDPSSGHRLLNPSCALYIQLYQILKQHAIHLDNRGSGSFHSLGAGQSSA
jgi:hypothetical protein